MKETSNLRIAVALCFLLLGFASAAKAGESNGFVVGGIPGSVVAERAEGVASMYAVGVYAYAFSLEDGLIRNQFDPLNPFGRAEFAPNGSFKRAGESLVPRNGWRIESSASPVSAVEIEAGGAL